MKNKTNIIIGTVMISLMLIFLIGNVYAQSRAEGFNTSSRLARIFHTENLTKGIEINDEVRRKFMEEEELISEEVKNIIEEKIQIRERTIKNIKHKFAVEKLCELSFNYNLIEEIKTDENTFLIIEISIEDISNLSKDKCVGKFADEHGMQGINKYIREKLENEFKETIRERKLKETVTGIEEIEEVDKEVEKIKEEIEKGEIEEDVRKISYYQYYVIPDNQIIINNAIGKTRKEIYEMISDSYWISDKILNGVSEKWLSPEFFISETKLMETNPTNEIASDCSEQANTLVSLLRSKGVSSKEVRVVLGIVDFNGESGHAWVEIFEDGRWLVLDPTSGNYWDEEMNQKVKRNPLPYNYFELHEYPVKEVYYYYNDKYFVDLRQNINNAPSEWGFEYSTIISYQLLELEEKPNIFYNIQIILQNFINNIKNLLGAN